MQKVGLLFGGKSPEHEVSINSARNVFGAIDKSRYQVLLIGIAPDGRWYYVEEEDFLAEGLDIAKSGKDLAVLPGEESDPIIFKESGASIGKLDVVFPVLHGPNGEDGRVQGLLMLLNLPFVGPGVVGSAVAMDKDFSKRLFKEANLLTSDYLVFYKFEADAIDYMGVVNQLGIPLFIKPANMGSSVGVSKADSSESFRAATDLAFRFDSKIIVEAFVKGREIECAVLGNEIPETTGAGEIVMDKGFYDYEAKYISGDAARLIIPAEVSANALAKIRIVARQAFQVLGCEGMARVDVFLTEDDDVYINEVNTIPGFTNISMYPKLWEIAGLPYSELITRLLELAIARFERDNALQFSRS